MCIHIIIYIYIYDTYDLVEGHVVAAAASGVEEDFQLLGRSAGSLRMLGSSKRLRGGIGWLDAAL